MGSLPVPSEANRKEDLEARVKKLEAFAKAHEAWEASILNDDSPWFDRMPDDIRDDFDKLQKLRNEALKT